MSEIRLDAYWDLNEDEYDEREVIRLDDIARQNAQHNKIFVQMVIFFLVVFVITLF